MLFSAQIMFFSWEFYLPATLTVSEPLSWLASPATEKPSPSLDGWVAGITPVAEAEVLKPSIPMGKDLGAHQEQQHPLTPAQSQPGCAAPSPQTSSFACRDVMFPNAHQGKGLFLLGACLHGVVAPASRAPSARPCSWHGTKRHGAFLKTPQGCSDNVSLFPVLLPP